MVFKDKRNLIFITIVLLTFLAVTYYQGLTEEAHGQAYSLPFSIGQWQGTDLQYDRDLLASWLGHPEITFRNYRNNLNGYSVSVYIAYYKDLNSSDNAHSPDVCYPGQGWQVVSDGVVPIDLSGKRVRFRRMDVEKNSENQIVYSWWQTENMIVPNNSWYHLSQILKKITFQNTASIWVRISADTMEGKKDSGDEMLRAFSREAAPLFHNFF